MIHEGGFKRRVHTEMDLHNKAEGKSAVKFGELSISSEEISNRIIQKLKNGKLKILVNLNYSRRNIYIKKRTVNLQT